MGIEREDAGGHARRAGRHQREAGSDDARVPGVRTAHEADARWAVLTGHGRAPATGPGMALEDLADAVTELLWVTGSADAAAEWIRNRIDTDCGRDMLAHNLQVIKDEMARDPIQADLAALAERRRLTDAAATPGAPSMRRWLARLGKSSR